MKDDTSELKTERLWLRPLEERDAGDLFVAFSDKQVCRFWSEDAHRDPAQTLAMIQTSLSNPGTEIWVITRGPGKPALGWVYLGDRPRNIAEIGYILRRASWGQGLVVEAARAVIAHAFETRNIRRLYLDTDPENTASIRVAEKLGFQFEGRARGNWETHLGVRDSLIFGRLNTDPDPFASSETGSGT